MNNSLNNMENFKMHIEERTGKTARELVEQDERPDYFDITQFDEIKNLKLGPCKVSSIPEDIREDVTHSLGFGGNLDSGLNYLYEYFEYLHEKGIKIPVNLEEFARLRDARTKEIYPLSLESVKAIGYACKYGSKDYNGELLACLTEFAYIEEVRFQVREMPCDIDDWFD